LSSGFGGGRVIGVVVCLEFELSQSVTKRRPIIPIQALFRTPATHSSCSSKPDDAEQWEWEKKMPLLHSAYCSSFVWDEDGQKPMSVLWAEEVELEVEAVVLRPEADYHTQRDAWIEFRMPPERP
jgi:hypothetical protein